MLDIIQNILKLFFDNNKEAYLVGGAPRNQLLGLKIDDFDICTNANKNEIKTILKEYHVYEISSKYQTVALKINNSVVEITPYRIDIEYFNHRHPNTIYTSSLKEDLKRRDFTINALCMDYKGKIIDYFDGLNDLKNKTIKTIGNPDIRFNEDALRILRAIRFKTKLNFDIDSETNKSLFKNKDLLKQISNERKKTELLEILKYPNAYKVIAEYQEIFDTFINLKIDNLNNDFTNPLFSLAYLIKDTNNDLKELKYSKSEIKLLNKLIQSTKISIQDEYQVIKLLSDEDYLDIISFLDTIYHKNFLTFYNLKKDYVVNIKTLKINSEKLINLNYQKQEIKNIQLLLIDLIHHQQLKNNHDDLLKYLKSRMI